MRTACHMCVQGMHVFESGGTFTTPVLGSIELCLTMTFPRTLDFEGKVAFQMKIVPRSNALAFKDILALTEFAATATFANGKVILNHWGMSATTSADMWGKVPSGS